MLASQDRREVWVLGNRCQSTYMQAQFRLVCLDAQDDFLFCQTNETTTVAVIDARICWEHFDLSALVQCERVGRINTRLLLSERGLKDPLRSSTTLERGRLRRFRFGSLEGVVEPGDPRKDQRILFGRDQLLRQSSFEAVEPIKRPDGFWALALVD